MPRIPLSNIDADPYYRAVGNRPEILTAWQAMDQAMLGPSSTLPTELKEEARRALAQNVGCAFCATVGGKPLSVAPDARTALAVALANQIAKDYTQVDDGMFEALREEFSDTEIAELLMWLCFKFGSNLFGALIKLDPATSTDATGYAAFLSDRAKLAEGTSA